MTHRNPRVLILLLLLLPYGSGAFTAAADPLEILRIHPSGEDVEQAHQIVFQFDRPVVPVGRMERDAAEIPITITPDPGCRWRWLDTSALACRLGDDTALVRSTRYEIVVAPGIAAEDGATLAAPVSHSFVTRRPAVTYRAFETWTSPGTPLVRLVFDQPVVPESVAEHVFYRVGGDRIAVSVEPFREQDNAVVVTPVEELPLDRKVALDVEPGVRSTLGPEPGNERRSIVVFPTFPEHRFLGVTCYDNDGKFIRVLASEPEARRRGCDPLRGTWLLFSSPVVKEILRDHLRVDPGLAGGREDYDPWDNVRTYSALSRVPSDHEYAVRLPEALLADESYRLSARAGDIRDEFDRPLARDVEFVFTTNHRRPRLHLGHTASVLESGVDTHLPVVVTNLEKIDVRSTLWTADTFTENATETIAVPEVEDVAFRHPLKVRDWLDGRSGVAVGRLTPTPATDRPSPWFFSEVTPFHVHVKLGHYNTLVWVTDLTTGRPVRGATVDVFERVYETLAGDGPSLSSAATDRDGLATLDGTDRLDPERKMSAYWRQRDLPHLLVRVVKDSAMAVVPLAEDFRVREQGPNRSYVSTARARRHGHLRAWGATAQGVYRAGDTVDYKIWVRNDGNERLEPAPPSDYELKVVDPTGKVVHHRSALELSLFGAFDGKLKVPETGAVGWYRFELRMGFAKDAVLQPMQVLVSDFTPSPFRVSSDLDGELFRLGDRVGVSSRASLHAGGPYVEASTRVTATLRTTPFRPDDPTLKGFWFQTGDWNEATVHRSEDVLDDRGELETAFEIHEEQILYGALTVESAVRDDRGKYVAGRGTARYAARDRFVGIRQEDWILQAGKPAEILTVVADEHGKPAGDTPVAVAIEWRKTVASRVKGAGNAYLTQYTHTWEKAADCESPASGEAVACTFTPDRPGLYRFTATVEDTQGRTTAGQMTRWAVGKGRVMWEEPAGHHLQVMPEEDTLRVGDMARYLVMNPFPGARALITVERFGVQRSWVRTFRDSTEIVEFPVEPDHLPGFYLSVTVMSPRVADAPVEDGVDLGKPAFRAGYVRTAVRDPYKELDVEVEPEAEVYKPRDRAAVDIRVRTRQGDTPDTELAVAVLDESVLDLLAAGTQAFDPYLGFYELESLDMVNYNLLRNLIGIQKFEKKGASPGGGGGPDPTLRSEFRFVSYWNPSIRPDRKGRARIEFDVPDNLTAWRVLVMAVTPGDRMGLGHDTFRVNRPTEIRPALPNQVIEGDRFEARFTVMNRTDRPRRLAVSGAASGSVEGEPRLSATVEAEPFKRYPVSVPVATGGPGELRLEVRAGDETDADALALTVPVRRRQALETAATYGTTLSNEAVESVRFPEDMRTDVGSLGVVAGPTVIGNLEGAFDYVRRYPYLCWEQRLAKGVMASHYVELRDYLPRELEWPDAASLTQAMLDDAANFQAPSGGMVYWVPRDVYVSPYLSAYTALAFRWLADRGHDVPEGVEDRLHDYLLKLLRRDAFPTFFTKGMASSVRAVALAALARADKVGLSDLRRYRDHVPGMDLFGRAHYLQALQRVEGTDDWRAEVRDAILGLADETGGQIVFTETLDDGYARILHSSMRTGCAVLGALVEQGEDDLARSGAAALPFKLVRTLTQTRGRRNHWENTQENVFCANALIDYSRAYERDAPDFTLDVSVDDEVVGRTRIADRRQEPVEFRRALRERDPGRPAKVRLQRLGVGRVYWSVRLQYSPATLKTEPILAGIEVRREYSVERDGAWVLLDEPAEVRQGELVRVDLYVSLPAARNFVVVDDPVPGGLEPVNRDLATASTVDADKAVFEFPPDAYYHDFDDWRSYGVTRWTFYHQELRHDSARFYSDYLPAGRYHLSYVAQVIAPGSFTILPLHAEEMYDPDVFGQGVPGTLDVEGFDE